MSDEPKTCDNCKHNDLKSCRYPCSECHWAMLDKWTPKDRKMTKGKVEFQVDQVGYDPIRITMLSHTGVIMFTQGDSKILLRKDQIKTFEQAIGEVRRWSSSP